MPEVLRTIKEYEDHETKLAIERCIIRCEAKNWSGAVALLETLVKKHPDSLLVRHELGVLYIKDGRYEEASAMLSYLVHIILLLVKTKEVIKHLIEYLTACTFPDRTLPQK